MNFALTHSGLFSLRAAQKLNLASKKKKQKAAAAAAGPVPVTSSAAASCDPPLFGTNFSTALLLAPPPAPPCLLRAANKIKDTPGLGKVKDVCELEMTLMFCSSLNSFELLDAFCQASE